MNTASSLFKKLSHRFWTDTQVRPLRPLEKFVLVRLICAPELSQIPGVVPITFHAIAASTGLGERTVRKCLAVLEDREFVVHDPLAGLYYLPNAWKYHPIKGDSQARGLCAAILNLPDTCLFGRIMHDVIRMIDLVEDGKTADVLRPFANESAGLKQGEVRDLIEFGEVLISGTARSTHLDLDLDSDSDSEDMSDSARNKVLGPDVLKVWEALADARAEVMPRSRRTSISPAARKAIAARIRVHGVEAALDVIAHRKAEVQQDPSKGQWFQHNTIFKSGNFENTLGRIGTTQAPSTTLQATPDDGSWGVVDMSTGELQGASNGQ